MEPNKRLKNSMARMGTETKKRPLNMSPDCLKFLETILHPVELKHDAPLADFIRNNVLEEIRRKVHTAYGKLSY